MGLFALRPLWKQHVQQQLLRQPLWQFLWRPAPYEPQLRWKPLWRQLRRKLREPVWQLWGERLSWKFIWEFMLHQDCELLLSDVRLRPFPRTYPLQHPGLHLLLPARVLLRWTRLHAALSKVLCALTSLGRESPDGDGPRFVGLLVQSDSTKKKAMATKTHSYVSSIFRPTAGKAFNFSKGPLAPLSPIVQSCVHGQTEETLGFERGHNAWHWRS